MVIRHQVLAAEVLWQLVQENLVQVQDLLLVLMVEWALVYLLLLV